MAGTIAVYEVILYLTAVIAGVISVIALLRRDFPGAIFLSCLMLAVLVWGAAYSLDLRSLTLSEKLFWTWVEYIGIVLIPPSWLFFTLHYTGLNDRFHPKSLLWLVIEPVATLAILGSSDLQGLFWKNPHLVQYGEILAMDTDYGVAFWIHTVYSYLLILASFVLMLRFFLSTKRYRRKQVGAVLIGGLFPWLGDILSVFRLSPSPYLDLTPFMFSLAGLFILWGVIRNRFLDVLPLARHTIIDGMNDGLMIIDNDGCILYLNSAASQLIGISAASALGEPAGRILPFVLPEQESGNLELAWTVEIEPQNQTMLQTAEIDAGKKTGRTFDLTMSSLKDSKNRRVGRMITWNDVTERRRTEIDLQHRVDELLTISKVSGEIFSLLDQQQVLDAIVRTAAEISRSDASGLCEVIEGGRLRLLAAYGVSQQFVEALAANDEIVEGSLIWRAVRERKPVQIVDVKDDAGYAKRDVTEIDGIRSILVLPMLRGDTVTGCIVIWHRQPRFFSPTDELFLQTLAYQGMTAAENARLFETERDQRKMAENLRQIGMALSASLNIDTLLDRLMDQITLLLPHDGASVFLVKHRPDGDKACLARARGYKKERVELLGRFDEISFDIAHTHNFVEMLETGRPLIIPDVLTYPGWEVISDVPYYRSWVGIPIFEGDRLSAIFTLDKEEPDFYRPEHIERLEIFAAQAGLAMQNVHLFDETNRRLREVILLSRVISLTSSADDIRSALTQICMEVSGFFMLKQAAFALINENGDAAEVIAEYHSQGHASALGTIIPVIGNPSMEYVLKYHAPLVVTEAQTDPVLAPVHSVMRLRNVASILIVPILIKNKVWGTLGIDSSVRREFTESEISLMQNIASQVSQVLERLELLAKTHEQTHQVQQIMDTVPEGVVLLDTRFNLLLANPVAQEYLAVLAGEQAPENGFVGLHLAKLGEKSLDEILQASSGEKFFDLEVKSPAHRAFEIVSRQLMTDGVEEGWVLLLRDVTKERQDQERIRMSERLATVGQLAAGIAHDFNNIMAAIVVYADLLALEPALSKASQDRLVIIQQQVQRATSLIRQILDFSRRSVMDKSDLDLLPFIKELDKLLGRVLPETIRMELTYQPGTYWVNGDPTRLQQVFMNLAVNARDAMPSGGVLGFDLAHLNISDDESLSHHDLTLGNWIRIRVADSGIGIPAEDLPHIFDPFFTTKSVGQGSGLGLAQVYGIIKQHGGNIEVESEQEKGTVFTIYLPAINEFTETTDLLTDRIEIKGFGKTLLVVEDDDAAREAMAALLETGGFRVVAASNGFEALQVFEQEKGCVSLVISDVVMPGMGGVALYTALRKANSSVKMLLVTGHPLEEQDLSSMADENVRWLQKPYSVQALLQAVKDLL